MEDHNISNACILPASAMFVMAIEAAKIMAILRSKNPISGLIIQNVVVSQALTIPPDADGIEMEFYLRPCRLASDREITWSDFRTYTPETNHWVEVCREQVRVTHMRFENEVDNGLEHSLNDEYHRTELSRLQLPKSRYENLLPDTGRKWNHFWTRIPNYQKWCLRSE